MGGCLPIDEHGRADFTCVPAGRYRLGTINRSGANYAPQFIHAADGETQAVALAKGDASLTGMLIVNGAPMSRPSLTCCPVITVVERDLFDRFSATAFDDGRYEFDGMDPGAYRLMFQADGCMPVVWRVNVKPGRNTFDITLPSTRLEGQIAATPSKPGRRETVLVQRMDASDRFQEAVASVDAQGRFHLDHLPPGRYAAKYYPESRLWLTMFEVPPAPPHPLNTISVELGPPDHTGWIVGGVTDARGATLDALVGPTLLAIPKLDAGYSFKLCYGVADNASRMTFRFKELPPGRYGLLAIPRSNVNAFAWLPDVEVREGLASKVELAVPAGRPVRMMLLDRQGRPTRATWNLRMPCGDWLPMELLSGQSVVVDNVGSTRLFPMYVLPAGEYQIDASPDGDAHFQQRFTTPAARAGDSSVLEVRIQMP